MSPGMPVFPVSPERVAGIKPPYNGPVDSPSMPDLRSASPLRGLSHRRNDSDISVVGLAAMFENLEVKDFKEAQARYMKAMEKQKIKHAAELKDLEAKQRLADIRYDMRVEELKGELSKVKEALKDTYTKEQWEKLRQQHRKEIDRWEDALQKVAPAAKKAKEVPFYKARYRELEAELRQWKAQYNQAVKDSSQNGTMVPVLQTQVTNLKRSLHNAESDVKHHKAQAEMFKNQVYGLQVDLESLDARSSQEIETLKDKLKLVEVERDTLKTSLREEQVLDIAAEGRIPLPAATLEEHDEFGSPVRSPRKPRTDRDDEDKENVAPRKTAVTLKFIQQELLSEKRLRERAEEQIEFMKMECQFQCCSCRIADLKGTKYVHDDTYNAEMEHIKASVPVMTPPSIHGDEIVEAVTIKQEPVDDALEAVFIKQEPVDNSEPLLDLAKATDTADHALAPAIEEPAVAFSPTTGTFKAIASPVKNREASPSTPARTDLSSIVEAVAGSSPWTPDANSTVIPAETASPPPLRPVSRQESSKKPSVSTIVIHEDAIEDGEDENSGPLTPPHGPSGPATPYLTRTITTTTTIPLHFSPVTPATKGNDMTPSTIAHQPTHTSSSHALADLSMNKLPFDRQAALEQIRERRGRARSMAAGHGTPRKQMMEGVMERRDISAPVGRIRR
ncbi:hypothetical protein BCR34DRAFT_597733 [Clohesyomyces aquaticus]|uniref:Uncharacterized protein n=1 Tax=Clohesyomyces aquaticus TaxID=1231657 RepID=A0A1Y2A1R7_9PLEO|nr:hypothetical protein BCR34DRAFT_597733 [Clohesyomyces aquaticus]